MLKKNLGKYLLAVSAAAGLVVVFAQLPGNAASAKYCTAHARTIAEHRVPTGSAGYERRFQRAFDAAYANCRGSGAGVMKSTVQQQALTAAPAPAAPASGGACDFSKYHTSWDPTQCP
jgi:hypothetical protein